MYSFRCIDFLVILNKIFKVVLGFLQVLDLAFALVAQGILDNVPFPVVQIPSTDNIPRLNRIEIVCASYLPMGLLFLRVKGYSGE
jgi:hypothetical protein